MVAGGAGAGVEPRGSWLLAHYSHSLFPPKQGGGTATPAGFINKLATQLLVGNATTAAALDTPSGLYASAALLARLNVANWDAGISAWYWKYKNACVPPLRLLRRARPCTARARRALRLTCPPGAAF